MSDFLLQHIALILDGNRRWATQQKVPAVVGYSKSISRVRDVIEECLKLNIHYVTVFALSTENLKRPQNQLKVLFNLMIEYAIKWQEDLVDKGVKITFIGRISELPDKLRNSLSNLEKNSASNDKLTLTICLNYGGRADIVEAIKKIVKDTQNNKLSLDLLTEDTIEKYLYTNGISDPDLLIRTGGDQRISNFLLWQLAYTEFYFTKTFFPDFTAQDLHTALNEYKQRNRRYGTN